MPSPRSIQVRSSFPTRNRAQRLGRTLHAACAQVGVDLEIVVVDDASDDDSADRLEELASRRDDLRVIRRASRGGPARARNTGIAAARAEWVALLDDDDLWAPQLRGQLNAAAARSADFAYAAAMVVNAALHPLYVEPYIPVLAVGGAASMGLYLSGRYAFGAMPPVMLDNLVKHLWRKLASRKVQAPQ